MSQRSNRGGARQYPRTARLNELLREILADELERLDDDRLALVTVTAVEVDPDLRHASVYVSTLGEGGAEADAEVLEALAHTRTRMQAAVAHQARTKRTPELAFRIDDVARSAARIEEILAEQHRAEAGREGPGAGEGPTPEG